MTEPQKGTHKNITIACTCGFELLTFRSWDNLLYNLSYCRPKGVDDDKKSSKKYTNANKELQKITKNGNMWTIGFGRLRELRGYGSWGELTKHTLTENNEFPDTR